MVRTAFPDLIDPALIEAAAVSAWGEAPERLIKRQQNRSRVTYEVRYSGKPAYLKAEIALQGRAQDLALEEWAMRVVRSLEIPAPEVLYSNLSMAEFPFRFVIMTAVPGMPIDQLRLSHGARARAIKTGAAWLHCLHSVKVAGFGRLDEHLYLSTGSVRGEHVDWRDMALRLRDDWLETPGDALELVASLEADGILSPAEARQSVARLKGGPDLVPALSTGCLLHGDFQAMHIFADPETGQATGLIDFGDRQSGDPEWEFSWTWWRDPASFEAALEGYREAGGVADRRTMDFYSLGHVLATLRLRFDSGCTEGLAAVKTRLKELLDT